jgi:dephospho-CoA kinase
VTSPDTANCHFHCCPSLLSSHSSPLSTRNHARYPAQPSALTTVVGLTGGIATGKSTVSSLLSSRHHLPIIDADILARDAIAPGSPGFRKVVAHFGADRILNADGSLNRSALGDIIFRDPNERQFLNGIIHPAVRRMMFMGVLRAWLRGEWCVVLDVPLLIEASLWKWVGEVMVVFV